MPLRTTEHIPIPTQDLLSWCWDNRHTYDQEKPLYVDCASGESLSATQFWSLVRRVIAGWRRLGLQNGDVVCIHSFNSVWTPVLVFGIVGAGGTFVGTNPSYTPLELDHALTRSKAKFVIAEQEVLNGIADAARRKNIPQERILVLADHDLSREGSTGTSHHMSWRTLLKHGEQDWLSFDDLETCKATTAILCFSSGTSGLPKAAQVSHYNLIAQHTLVHENPKQQPNWAMSRMACLPFFHASTVPYVFASCLRSGLPSHIMRRFALHQFLEYVEKYQSTALVVVPPMVAAIVNLAESKPELASQVKKHFRSVRWAISGGAPLDSDMQTRFQALLPKGSPFTQLWGATETSCIGTFFYYNEHDSTGAVGRPIPNIDIRLVNEDGVEVGDDVPGELHVRGPTVISGYLDAPDANKESWDDEEFYHTGDIVVRKSANGLLYVVDRKKELIKVRGFQVAPAELEGVLLGHPGILDAAVIGVPDTMSGEVPRAYVVAQTAGELQEKDVKEWVAERMARYKSLDGGVRFVDAIPKNASGKILKRELRAAARKESQSAKF